MSVDYWDRKPIGGQCFHCRRPLTDENTSDYKSLSLGPNAQWCDICAYITHPDGEGEWECETGLVICSVCRSRSVIPEREICAECRTELDGDTSDVGTQT